MRGRVGVATGAASFVRRNLVYQMTQQRWSPEPARIDIHAAVLVGKTWRAERRNRSSR
jgi:hypothetical protein